VVKFRLKETGFLTENRAGMFFCRIIGIAPLKTILSVDKKTVKEGATPLFWVYYPDLRPMLVIIGSI
jgi:hypothetical protein